MQATNDSSTAGCTYKSMLMNWHDMKQHADQLDFITAEYRATRSVEGFVVCRAPLPKLFKYSDNIDFLGFNELSYATIYYNPLCDEPGAYSSRRLPVQ